MTHGKIKRPGLGGVSKRPLYGTDTSDTFLASEVKRAEIHIDDGVDPKRSMFIDALLAKRKELRER